MGNGTVSTQHSSFAYVFPPFQWSAEHQSAVPASFFLHISSLFVLPVPLKVAPVSHLKSIESDVLVRPASLSFRCADCVSAASIECSNTFLGLCCPCPAQPTMTGSPEYSGPAGSTRVRLCWHRWGMSEVHLGGHYLFQI
jgi:hypothetical protein